MKATKRFISILECSFQTTAYAICNMIDRIDDERNEEFIIPKSMSMSHATLVRMNYDCGQNLDK
jgi:hypothetical protein